MLHLLWDESHLWGVLLARALSAWDLPWRLVSARQVRAGALAEQRPACLLVPGGFASRKGASLGRAGLAAVREYVASGGAYLGICGGAGLGLTVPGGLGLCPWTRAPFATRLQHFASGGVHLTPDPESVYVPRELDDAPLAPVWWPARFFPQDAPGPGNREGARRGGPKGTRAPDQGPVEVVARYGKPGPDFFMADIPLAMVPGETLEDWEALYGVRLAPSFSEGDPCIVAGRHGRGRYVLSHAHLETPASPQANAWLGHILAELAGLARVPDSPAPDWAMGRGDPAWNDPALERAMDAMLDTARLGIEHGLLTWREPWLLGWRQGLPGAQISGLLAMLDHARRQTPGPQALDYWRAQARGFARNADLLAKGLSGYLLAERLALTLWRVDPQAVPQRGLAEARLTLFGPPPGSGAAGGGLCGQVLGVLENFVWLCGQKGK